MQAKGLVDTGFLLALLDADDGWHQRCVKVFPTVRLPLATSAAVLAELFHLVGDNASDTGAAWRLVLSGAITLSPITDQDLPPLHRLMRRYADRPMDFTDATLVHIAERESLSSICTIDNDDFETYRIGGKRRFRIVPGR